MSLLLADVADASAAVARDVRPHREGRRVGRDPAASGPDEVAPVVAWLSGELTQRQVGVGWASLAEPPSPMPDPRS